MTIDMYNEFAAGGCLLIPHILVKVLSANTCVLLSRLISEYNYANNHKLNRDNDFLSSFSHLKNILGFNDEELNIALNDLIKIGFISIFPSGILKPIA